ncbi:hypothetical protein [Stutzerimonas urumqiensis]|uniref:hypothetical protein n=1 Tax=Stutzerimonas urumqiensis TaxID=638269 RepID=UPI0013CEE1AF|nr:hypothetical protein [Stutzerimonas urumqiensis]
MRYITTGRGLLDGLVALSGLASVREGSTFVWLLIAPRGIAFGRRLVGRSGIRPEGIAAGR